MTTRSTFDKTLEQLLTSDEKRTNDAGDVENQIDHLPDEGHEEEEPEDLHPVRYENVDSRLPANPEDVTDRHDDYVFARSNLYGLIGRSNAALELSLRLAAMSEQPRALEVAAQLMRTSSDMTKELIALQKMLKEEDSKGGPSVQNNTQNNHYYNAQDNTNTIDNEIDALGDDSE